MTLHKQSILTLPYPIPECLRTDPDLGLSIYSTREDVRRVRHLIPCVKKIGRKQLTIIDEWLREEDRDV